MNEVGLFTPISYQHILPPEGEAEEIARIMRSRSDLERVSQYFNLSGRVAYVVPGYFVDEQRGVAFSEERSLLIVKILKIISYCTVIIPLCFYIAICVLRKKRDFYVINLEKEIAKEVDVEMCRTRFSTAANSGEKILDSETYKIGDGSFFYQTEEGLNFSVCKRKDNKVDPKIEEHYRKLIKAKEVVLAHHLGLLLLPKVARFTVRRGDIQRRAEGDTYDVIVEKWAPKKKEEYKKENLENAVKQLTRFMCYTGYSNFTANSTSVMDKSIALVDLKGMKREGAKKGLFSERRILAKGQTDGLINCLFHKSQMDALLEEARRNGVYPDDRDKPEEIIHERLLALDPQYDPVQREIP